MIQFLIVFLWFSVEAFAQDSLINNSTQVDFSIKKGINLNGWLEVKSLDSVRLDTMVSLQKIRSLREYGFDHVRIPVSEEIILDDSLNFRENVKERLVEQIDNCLSLGLKVIFDLHVTRQHHFGRDNNALFAEKEAQRQFFLVWEKLQQLLKPYPVEFLAYECLNEPAAPQHHHNMWNDLLNEWISFIRKKEPRRILFVGTNRGNQIWTLKYLQIYPSDSNIILTFHFYKPTIFTHYNKNEMDSFLNGDVPTYPGKAISLGTYKYMPESYKKKYSYSQKEFGIAEIRTQFKTIFEWAQKYNIQVNLGEFGCRRFVDRNARYAWLRDVINTARAFNFSYTLWGLNGAGFGIRDTDKGLDSTMLNIILQKN